MKLSHVAYRISQVANVAERCCLLQPSLSLLFSFYPLSKKIPDYVCLQFHSLHRSHGLLLGVSASLVLEREVVWWHERKRMEKKKVCEFDYRMGHMKIEREHTGAKVQ